MKKFSYSETRNNPPQLKIKGGAREVIFTTVSCMCDNISYLHFKKDDGGDFKMSGRGNALSNWQMEHPKHEIEWMADGEEWDNVIKMINTGTSKICEVVSR
jgi:hypothetical protein